MNANNMMSYYGRENNAVRRDKASSSPKVRGEIYQGIVKRSYSDGRVVIDVPALGGTYGPILPIGLDLSSRPIVGDYVFCAFSNESMTSMVIFGVSKIASNRTSVIIVDNISLYTPPTGHEHRGSLVYNLFDDKYYGWNGTTWTDIGLQGPAGPAGPQGPSGNWSTAQTVVAYSSATSGGVLLSSSAGKLVYNTAAQVVTITSSTAFSTGQRVDLARLNAGAFTVAQGSGAVVNATPALTLRAQYSAASIICTSSNTYLVTGDLG